MTKKLDLNLKEPKKAGYCNPPNRFSSENQPENRGRPKGQLLTTLLRKYLEKNISFEDPETQKIVKGKVKDAIVWRLILNATQGDNQAIKEIFERLEGKLTSGPLVDLSKHTHITVEIKTDDKSEDQSPFSLEAGSRMESSSKV